MEIFLSLLSHFAAFAVGATIVILVRRVLNDRSEKDHENRPADNKSVFISYRRSDSFEQTKTLFDHLSVLIGEECIFRDIDLQEGIHFPSVLAESLETCSAALVIIGPSWMSIQNKDGGLRIFDQDDWVHFEVKSIIRCDMTIVPVLVDGAQMPEAKHLPPSISELANRQAIFVDDGNYADAARRIRDRLNYSGSGGRAHEMRLEHAEIWVDLNTSFWEGVRAAYAEFKDASDLEYDLHQFVLKAGLPLQPGAGIDWLDFQAPTAPEAAVLMWKFATRIYPLDNGGSTRDELMRISIVPDNLVDAFMNARSKLAGFWERWARARSLSSISVEYSGDFSQIVLLLWLDIAHRKWTGERNKNKYGMLRLCQTMSLTKKRFDMAPVSPLT